MAARPNLSEMRSQSQASHASNSSASKPLRSPRLHIAGEVPPELSPLDAFALQSRLLAKQLQESAKGGNRISRLPPLTTSSPLIMQGRSDYFRSMNQDSGSEHSNSNTNSPEQLSAGLGLRTEIVDDQDARRPVSMHPRMSRIPPTPDESIPLPPPPSITDLLRGRPLSQAREGEGGLFGARREQSPTPIEGSAISEMSDDASMISKEKEHSLPVPSPKASASLPMSISHSPEAKQPKGSFDSTLAPPRQLFPRRSSSIMSSPLEPTDEAVMSTSFHSLPPRKLSSSSSAFSMPPVVSPPFARSPSVSSDASLPLPRPSFNFSRPLSRAGTPGLETPSRQASSDSQPSFVFADESAHTPVSMNSEGFPDPLVDDGKSAAPSYIYSKFSLPRGKTIQRSLPLENQNQPQASFHWEQPIRGPSNMVPIPPGAPPSPPTRPSSSGSRPVPDDLGLMQHSEQRKPSMAHIGPAPQPSPNPSRPSTDSSRVSEDAPRGRALTSPIHDATARGRTPMSTTTSDSASTVRPPKSQHSIATTISNMTAEEHLAKGIECHENGSLNESTYHLRHAAKQHHPTGMLLYALACRHGWGMRPNQAEGVEWLKKAAEYASVEIADDEELAKDGKFVDGMERKTRKAQFALSIYELGVSHMNGWGIEQDKALALRCFEIAGTWGDVDALAEAGFCYAQGIGCKKDLKKSAKFYRMAEAKGMSMVGNSWIHKSKYSDEKDSKAEKEKKKARSKSRSRNIFGLRIKEKEAKGATSS